MEISTHPVPRSPHEESDAPLSARTLELWDAFANIAQALAHPYRLLLLNLLEQSPRDVETLARLLHVRIATASQHLQKLKHAALVVDERHGRRRVYRLSHPAIRGLVESIGRVAELTSDRAEKLYHELFAEIQDEPPVRPEELRRLLARQEAILVDIRPREEYEHDHTPGAISVPLSVLSSAQERLPRKRLLVVTCRGRYCLLALEAIQQLRSQGFRVRRYEEGVLAPAPHETNENPLS